MSHMGPLLNFSKPVTAVSMRPTERTAQRMNDRSAELAHGRDVGQEYQELYPA